MALDVEKRMSPLWGSNPRPYAYEAHALPAELRRLVQVADLSNKAISNIFQQTWGDVEQWHTLNLIWPGLALPALPN